VLDAWLDGELDQDRAAQVEAHLNGCAACSASARDRRALTSALAGPSLYHRAPEGLRESLFSPMTPVVAPRPRRPRAPVWAWFSLAASIALASAVIWLAAGRFSRPSPDFIHEAVSAHIRSLMAAHLLDIPSSDRHTVKPWFAGKVAFAPPVPDLAAEGYPLAGGRLDYIAGRPVAAIVYTRRAHTINVFVSPDDAGRPVPPAVRRDRGYTVVTWSDGVLRSSAVSDASEDELMPLVRLLRSEQGSGDPPPRR
jgi:anti-sigma factor RsiW